MQAQVKTWGNSQGIRISKEILKAANKEFARVPLEQASIKNIVEDAEIARGSFYQYFENKQDLFEYIMTSKTGDMEKNLIEMIEQENGNIINLSLIHI